MYIKDNKMKNILLACIATVFASCSVQGGKKFDYKDVKAEFRAAKEGMFSNKAQYGLLVLGKKAEYSMWVVFDCKKPKNVVYIDNDCDGIVGEEGEMLEMTDDNGYYETHILKEWNNPETKELTQMKAILWKGNKEKKVESHVQLMFDVQGVNTVSSLVCSKKIAEAGKMRVGFNQELSLLPDDIMGRKFEPLFYYEEGRVHNSPKNTRVKNYRAYNIATKGTNGSYWSLCYTYLPEEEGLVAKVVYKDKDGQNKTYKSKLNKRC